MGHLVSIQSSSPGVVFVLEAHAGGDVGLRGEEVLSPAVSSDLGQGRPRYHVNRVLTPRLVALTTS